MTFSDGSELICSNSEIVFDKIDAPTLQIIPCTPRESEEKSNKAGKMYGRLFKYKKTVGKHANNLTPFVHGWKEVQKGHLFGTVKLLQELQIMLRFTFKSTIVLSSAYELVPSNAKVYVVNTKKMKVSKMIALTLPECILPINNVAIKV